MKKTMLSTLGLAAMALSVSLFSTAQADVLKLELPEPYFGGTPLDYYGENLEEPNYKKRPDFEVPAGRSVIPSRQRASRRAGEGLPAAGFRQHLHGSVGRIDRDDLMVAARHDQLTVETPRQLLVLTLGGRAYRPGLSGS